MDKVLFFLGAILVVVSCSSDLKSVYQLPEEARHLSNLKQYSPETEPVMDIFLDRERLFRSSEEVLIGKMVDLAVDKRERLFIADSRKHTIHVLDLTKSFITSMGREGGGPGEFQLVGNLRTIDSLLFSYDGLQRRINIFRLDSLKLAETINLNRIDLNSFPGLSGYHPASVRFLKKDRYLIGFETILQPNPSVSGFNMNNFFTVYYKVNDDVRIISDKIMEQEAYRALTARAGGEWRSTQFLFLGKPLLAVSKDQEVYTARTTEFLIKVRDSNGKYQRAIYYPVKKQSFNREEALRRQKDKYPEVYGYRSSVIRNAPDEQIPEYWPVLDDMLIDDQKRLWVSTVTEDPNKLRWWVLDKKGKLLARFIWPKRRQIETIKNGKVYARITKENGVSHIVRYNMTMK
ncbi:6-bladed beta-propeller [Fodinibius halophilus]|uniref:6-bladed beta-propeller n=1 Tax=Fodinibius halophilus TaxID=1736908 RepID=A0A6M1T7Q8_9BACT|nr:6-bladed beta-propeller [Fodinibius halophilus]NGP90099.1 hypothetical protein [Fodinibius halophilus]